MTENALIRKVRSEIRAMLSKRNRHEEEMEKSASTTNAPYLIKELQREIERIFDDNLD